MTSSKWWHRWLLMTVPQPEAQRLHRETVEPRAKKRHPGGWSRLRMNNRCKLILLWMILGLPVHLGKVKWKLFTCGSHSWTTSFTFKHNHTSLPLRNEFIFAYVSPQIAKRKSICIPVMVWLLLNQSTEFHKTLNIHYIESETSDIILNIFVNSFIKVNTEDIFVFMVTVWLKILHYHIIYGKK